MSMDSLSAGIVDREFNLGKIDDDADVIEVSKRPGKPVSKGGKRKKIVLLLALVGLIGVAGVGVMFLLQNPTTGKLPLSADLASIVQKASQPASLPVKQLPPESPPVAIQPVPAAPGAQPPFPGDLAPAVPVPSANPGNAASSGGLAKVEQPPAPPLTPVLPAAVSPPVAPKVVEAPSVSPANAVMSPPVPSAAPVSSPSVPMAKEPVKVGDALPKPAGSDASAKLVEQRLLQVEKRIDALTAQLSGLSTQMQMQPTSQAKQVQTVAAKPAGKSDLPVMEISLKSLGVDKILDDGVVLSRNQEPASIGDAVKEFGGARLVRVDPKAGLIVTDRKMYKIK